MKILVKTIDVQNVMKKYERTQIFPMEINNFEEASIKMEKECDTTLTSRRIDVDVE